MLTVEADGVSVERRLRSGDLRCPGCGGVLAGWGWARMRVLRGACQERLPIRPRRSRCGGCGHSHVLLPVVALLRRADGVEAIGRALEAKARGQGHRAIAAAMDRPPSTVRGWLRAFTARAEPVRSAFTTLLVAVAGAEQMVLPAAASADFGDAVSAVIALSVAVWRRFGQGSFVNTMSAWLLACAVTNGCLLAPPGPGKLINTSSLWEAAG